MYKLLKVSVTINDKTFENIKKKRARRQDNGCQIQERLTSKPLMNIANK